MDKFLDIYSQQKLNQEEIENLNSSVTRSEIESVIIIIKKTSNKSPRPDGFTEEFISILLKLYQKNSRGITPKFIPQGHYYLDIKTR